MAELTTTCDELRETVRERYAVAARATTGPSAAGGCCGSNAALVTVAGALARDEYARYLADAGWTDIEITETHRVHEHAGSAIIRARKPVTS